MIMVVRKNGTQWKPQQNMQSQVDCCVPGRLDPLATQHAEHDHERVQEVDKVPARYFLGEVLRVVVGAKHLHGDDTTVISEHRCIRLALLADTYAGCVLRSDDSL